MKSLDAILLTHDHPDHSGGLDYIIDNFEVGEFWSTRESGELRTALRQRLLRHGVAIRQYALTGDWSRSAPGGLQDLFLFRAAADATGENNRSLCAFLPTPAGGVLLTGDLEAEGVESLMEGPLPGAVGVLKAPHHGSRSSNPEKILARYRPEIVVASAGYQNSYHFPAQELLDQATRQGIRVWRTDLDGTVRMRVDGRRWRVDHWANGLFR